MKETPRTLSIFLFIVGLAGIWNVVGVGAAFNASIIDGVVTLIGIGFGVVNLYIAVRLKNLLQRNLRFLLKFFWIEILFPFLVIIINIIRTGVAPSLAFGLFVVVVNTLILSYIIHQVKKLSQQSQIASPALTPRA